MRGNPLGAREQTAGDSRAQGDSRAYNAGSTKTARVAPVANSRVLHVKEIIVVLQVLNSSVVNLIIVARPGTRSIASRPIAASEWPAISNSAVASAGPAHFLKK